jgi:tetratricopeptide (TPR) repeat protein
MRQILTLALCLLIGSNLFGQDDKLKELISQGIKYHDQGKYDEAIAEYKAALELDKKSTIVNYELSYTYFASKQYDNAIKYSTVVIKQNSGNQHESYIVLGSSLYLTGKPSKAIKIYEEGLAKFPNSNLLNYNLALTCYNQKKYEKAETAAIDAIKAKPTHGSSHIILSAIMHEKDQRVKSILPLYYFLMIEPNSKRSLINYNRLRGQLGQGVEKKDDKNINVSFPAYSSSSSEFGAAEIMITLLEASKYTEENKDKNEFELFVETNSGIFGILGELKKDNTGFWWDLYVATFYDLVQADNIEAYSYYISQATNNELVNNWISENSEKMQKITEWIKIVK